MPGHIWIKIYAIKLDLLISPENLEEKRKRIEIGRIEAGSKCRVQIEDLNIVEVIEDARLHFVKFETRQIEKCLDYIRDTLMMSEEFSEVFNKPLFNKT